LTTDRSESRKEYPHEDCIDRSESRKEYHHEDYIDIEERSLGRESTFTVDTEKLSAQSRDRTVSPENEIIVDALEVNASSILKENGYLHLQISQLVTTVKSAGDLLNEALTEKEIIADDLNEALLEKEKAETALGELESRTVEIIEARDKLDSDLGILLNKNYDCVKQVEKLTNGIYELQADMLCVISEKEDVEDKLSAVTEERNNILSRQKGKSWCCV